MNLTEYWKEYARVKSQRTRAIDNRAIATLTLDEWLAILAYFNYLCAYCKNVPFTVMEHITPFDCGGGTVASNVVPACHSCNGRKGKNSRKLAREVITEIQRELNQFLAEHGPFDDPLSRIATGDVRAELGIGYQALRLRMDKLGIETIKIPFDKRKYITRADIERIKEA